MFPLVRGLLWGVLEACPLQTACLHMGPTGSCSLLSDGKFHPRSSVGKFPSMGKFHAHPLSNAKSKPHDSEQDGGQSTDESDVSWIAEADDDPPGRVVPKEIGNLNSDESWVAEDSDQPGPSNGPAPFSRPVSIALAKKELSLLADTDSPSTPYAYVVGEGKAGVAEQSSSLLTTGTEMTVQYVANPAYADRSPEMASASRAVAPAEAGIPSAKSHRLQVPSATSKSVSVTSLSTQHASTTSQDAGQEVVSRAGSGVGSQTQFLS